VAAALMVSSCSPTGRATWPRWSAPAVLLLSRRLHSAQVMGFVDWQLLLLFIGLFVVNHAFETTGLAAQAVAWLAGQGVHLAEPGPLLVVGVALSNLVSNVPAVMLLLPHLQGHAPGGARPALRAGAGQHLRRQPAAGGLDRQPDRGGPGAPRRRILRHRNHRLEAVVETCVRIGLVFCRYLTRGFVLEGVMRHERFDPDGTPRDTCLYARVR
jgi:hypothetical protein